MLRDRNKQFSRRASIGSLLTAPFRWFFGSIVSLASGSDSTALGQQFPLHLKLWYTIKGIVYLPFFLVFQVLRFVVLSWTTTRNGAHAFWSVLPIAGIVAVLGIVLVADMLQKRRILGIQQSGIQSSIQAEQPEQALAFAKRVVSISGTDSSRFTLVSIADANGLEENAIQLASEIASIERPGYPRAHMFLADKSVKLRANDENTRDEKTEEAMLHLQVVINNLKAQSGRQARFMYNNAVQKFGRLAIDLGDENAIARFATPGMCRLAPDLVPKVYEYVKTREPDRAELLAREGIAGAKARIDQNPNFPAVWQSLTNIYLTLNDYTEAERTLRNGIRTSNRFMLPYLHRLMSQVQSGSAEFYAKQVRNRDDFRRRLGPICSALAYGPRQTIALRDFTELVIDPPETLNYDAWLDQEVSEVGIFGMPHLISGIRDCIANKPVTASQHFRLAFKGFPGTVLCVDQIALYLYRSEARPNDALKIIDVAIATWPTATLLLSTRGQILTGMDRLDEAVSEIQYVLDSQPNSIEALAAMAECCEKQGLSEKADGYRLRVRDLVSEARRKRQETLERLASGEQQ